MHLLKVDNVCLSKHKCPTHTQLSGRSLDIGGATESKYVTCVSHVCLCSVDLSSSVGAFFLPFPNLVNVSLLNCQLGTLVGIAACCKSLVSLAVSKNDIAQIPDDFETLKNTLQYLDVSENPIRQIPDFMATFQRLWHLDVSNTLVREFPQNIGSLRSLRILDAKHTPIGHLPQSFCRLRVNVVASYLSFCRFHLNNILILLAVLMKVMQYDVYLTLVHSDMITLHRV